MKIKKIIVDKKPKSCSDCYFRGIPSIVVPEYSCDLFDTHGDMFESCGCPLYEEQNK